MTKSSAFCLYVCLGVSFICAAIVGYGTIEALPSQTPSISVSLGEEILIVRDPFITGMVLTLSMEELGSMVSDVRFEAGRFSGAEISPSGDQLAISVHGGVNDWVGVLTLADRSVESLSIVSGGTIYSMRWSPDSRYLAVNSVPASDFKTIVIYDVPQNRPLGALPDLIEIETYDPRWNPDGSLTYMQMIDGVESTGSYSPPN